VIAPPSERLPNALRSLPSDLRRLLIVPIKVPFRVGRGRGDEQQNFGIAHARSGARIRILQLKSGLDSNVRPQSMIS
jgi:hypothetical protein